MRPAGEFRESRLLGWEHRLQEDWEAARGALENYDAAIEALSHVPGLAPENTDAVAGMGLVMME